MKKIILVLALALTLTGCEIIEVGGDDQEVCISWVVQFNEPVNGVYSLMIEDYMNDNPAVEIQVSQTTWVEYKYLADNNNSVCWRG